MTLDETPSMPEEVIKHARQLSFQHLQPPVKIVGYKLDRFLGRGAFGEVWKGEDTNSGRQVAIKFFRVKAGFDWSLLSREVDKLQQLFNERYVVQLLKIGWDSQPPYFIAEFMEQGSLEDKLRFGNFSVEDAVRLIREIAEGLVHIHGKGILHCDLKPANILFDRGNRPRIADFGQSRLSGDESPSLGTLFYMAPEQADPRARPDVKWDVYALGAIFYRLVSGKLPFESDEIKTALRKPKPLKERLSVYRKLIREAPAPSAHKKPLRKDSALVRIIDRCLSRNRHHRYDNMQEVLEALEQRDIQRTQGPLFRGGILGSVALIVILFLFAGMGFRTAVSSSEDLLLERAVETNRNSAGNVSREVGLQIDQYWRILEQIAAHSQLRKDLLSYQKELTVDFEGLDSKKQRQSWIESEGRLKLQQWIEKKSADTQSTIPHITLALVNAQGRQYARVPQLDGRTLGENWSFRDYFNGIGKDQPKDSKRYPPIRQPHLSNLFRNQSKDKYWGIAFSVPVWKDNAGDGDPIAVLVMQVEVKKFKLPDLPNRWVVLFDTRPVAGTQTRGAILQLRPPTQVSEADRIQLNARADNYLKTTVHPNLVALTRVWDKVKQTNLPQDNAPPFLQGAPKDATIQEMAHYVRQKLKATDRGSIEACPYGFGSGFLEDGTDEDWLMAVDTIRIARTGGEYRYTELGVLVQIDKQTTLQPVEKLRTELLFMGTVGLFLILFAMGCVWVFVLVVLKPTSQTGWVIFLRKRLSLPVYDTATPSSIPSSGAHSWLSGSQGRPSNYDTEKKHG